MKKLLVSGVAALFTTALLTAAPAHGQTVKCFKPDGTEEPCSSRQLDMFPDADTFGPVTRTPLRAEYGGRVHQHIERWKALAESGDDVEIRDLCASACTLVTARPRARQRNRKNYPAAEMVSALPVS